MEDVIELIKETHDKEELDPPDVAEVKPIGEEVSADGDE